MPASADWLALVRAVCETPEDDLPRLVAADWLDDHGDPDRAAFIRAQVEYDRIPERPVCEARKRAKKPGEFCGPRAKCAACEAIKEYDARREEIYVRGSGWEQAHGAAACGFKLRGKEWRATYRRGFVATVRLPAKDFLKRAGEIFRAEPIQWVTLAGVRPYMGYNLAGQQPSRTFWQRSAGTHGVDGVLPGPLYDLLANPEAPVVWSQATADRDAYHAARDDLNAACLTYGRRAAGLSE